MINLVPQCAKCGSPVSDLVEPEIQEHGEVKPGHYIDSIWICDECSQFSEDHRQAKERDNYNDSEKRQQTGKASTTDVSPNSPRADET